MIKYDGRIVQFGFGAVGKSFYEKLPKEIRFNENKYYVITANRNEFDEFIAMGGLAANFIVADVNRQNFGQVFEPYLSRGDILIDFADMVGTRDICEWCAERNIMYINTGEADWPDHWYSIFSENELKNELKAKYAGSTTLNCHPIVLHHGNNPGLVSHFVKAAIEYVANTQFKKDKNLKSLIKEGKFNKAAQYLGVRQIHVNDVDLQEMKGEYQDNLLYSTWCMESFWFEMLSEATINIGTHEKIDYEEECNFVKYDQGFLEFKRIAANSRCVTYYPNGKFEAYLVPHEETVSIAKNLEVKEDNEVIYRPTVLFLYQPCPFANRYFREAKVNDYPNPDPNKPQDCEEGPGPNVIHGYLYPKNFQVAYQEHIAHGTEYVGILLLGEKFEPVWVGNRIEPSFLYKNKKDSYWQTPTITPVSMSALAAVVWMLKNKNAGGIYFPDDIPDYSGIIKMAEKYISKTIYQTFTKKEVADALKIDFENLQVKDILVEYCEKVR